jgi:hypothetical protein
MCGRLVLLLWSPERRSRYERWGVAFASHYFCGHTTYHCSLLPIQYQVTYFNFSRGVLVDHMEKRHLQATEHLKDARKFGQTMAKDREARLPPLTPEQREQMQEYLKLLKQTQPDVYPKESGRWE